MAHLVLDVVVKNFLNVPPADVEGEVELAYKCAISHFAHAVLCKWAFPRSTQEMFVRTGKKANSMVDQLMLNYAISRTSRFFFAETTRHYEGLIPFAKKHLRGNMDREWFSKAFGSFVEIPFNPRYVGHETSPYGAVTNLLWSFEQMLELTDDFWVRAVKQHLGYFQFCHNALGDSMTLPRWLGLSAQEQNGIRECDLAMTSACHTIRVLVEFNFRGHEFRRNYVMEEFERLFGNLVMHLSKYLLCYQTSIDIPRPEMNLEDYFRF